MSKLAIIVTTALTATLGASALAEPAAIPAPIASLQKLVGEWKATGTLTTGGKTFPLTGEWSCKTGAGGLGVRCSLVAKGIPGMATYEEMDIFGFDPGDRLVHWYSVTNAGETHDHKGSWVGEKLVVQHTGSSKKGRLLTERGSLDLGNPGTLVLKCQTTIGDETTAVFDVTMTR